MELGGAKTLSNVFRSYDVDGDGYLGHSDLTITILRQSERFQLGISKQKAEALASAVFDAAGVGNVVDFLSQSGLDSLVQQFATATSSDSPTHDAPSQPPPVGRGHWWTIYRDETIFSALYLTFCLVLFLIGGAAAYWNSDILSCEDTDGCVSYAFLAAKGFGMVLDINFALIILPVLRWSVTTVRRIWPLRLLPLDALPKFHVFCAIVIMLASTGHIVGHVVNFGMLTTNSSQNASLPEYLFVPSPHLVPGLIRGYACVTGWILVVLLCLLMIFSLPVIRRGRHFQVFYCLHKLHIPIWTLLVLHAEDFWKYFCAVGLLFIAEKMYKYFVTTFTEAAITETKLLPGGVIQLLIKRPERFAYNPGDYVFVKIPALATYEWHPFTISSAPELEGKIWLHVRVVGNWTAALALHISEQKRSRRPCAIVIGLRASAVHLRDFLSDPCSMKVFRTLSSAARPAADNPGNGHGTNSHDTLVLASPIPVYLDGPYGSSTSAIFHPEHAVLIGAGIGVTPFASILRSLLYQCNASEVKDPNERKLKINNRRLRLKKVDFIWICRDLESIQWFLDLLHEWEAEQKALNGAEYMSAEIYVTGGPKVSDLSAVGLSLGLGLEFKRTQADALTGLRTQTKTGRPDWTKVFEDIDSS